MHKTKTEISWVWRGYDVGIPQGSNVLPNGALASLDGCVVVSIESGLIVSIDHASEFRKEFEEHNIYIPLGLL